MAQDISLSDFQKVFQEINQIVSAAKKYFDVWEIIWQLPENYFLSNAIWRFIQGNNTEGKLVCSDERKFKRLFQVVSEIIPTVQEPINDSVQQKYIELLQIGLGQAGNSITIIDFLNKSDQDILRIRYFADKVFHAPSTKCNPDTSFNFHELCNKITSLIDFANKPEFPVDVNECYFYYQLLLLTISIAQYEPMVICMVSYCERFLRTIDPSKFISSNSLIDFSVFQRTFYVEYISNRPSIVTYASILTNSEAPLSPQVAQSKIVSRNLKLEIGEIKSKYEKLLSVTGFQQPLLTNIKDVFDSFLTWTAFIHNTLPSFLATHYPGSCSSAQQIRIQPAPAGPDEGNKKSPQRTLKRASSDFSEKALTESGFKPHNLRREHPDAQSVIPKFTVFTTKPPPLQKTALSASSDQIIPMKGQRGRSSSVSSATRERVDSHDPILPIELIETLKYLGETVLQQAKNFIEGNLKLKLETDALPSYFFARILCHYICPSMMIIDYRSNSKDDLSRLQEIAALILGRPVEPIDLDTCDVPFEFNKLLNTKIRESNQLFFTLKEFLQLPDCAFMLDDSTNKTFARLAMSVIDYVEKTLLKDFVLPEDDLFERDYHLYLLRDSIKSIAQYEELFLNVLSYSEHFLRELQKRLRSVESTETNLTVARKILEIINPYLDNFKYFVTAPLTRGTSYSEFKSKHVFKVNKTNTLKYFASIPELVSQLEKEYHKLFGSISSLKETCLSELKLKPQFDLILDFFQWLLTCTNKIITLEKTELNVLDQKIAAVFESDNTVFSRFSRVLSAPTKTSTDMAFDAAKIQFIFIADTFADVKFKVERFFFTWQRLIDKNEIQDSYYISKMLLYSCAPDDELRRLEQLASLFSVSIPEDLNDLKVEEKIDAIKKLTIKDIDITIAQLIAMSDRDLFQKQTTLQVPSDSSVISADALPARAMFENFESFVINNCALKLPKRPAELDMDYFRYMLLKCTWEFKEYEYMVVFLANYIHACFDIFLDEINKELASIKPELQATMGEISSKIGTYLQSFHYFHIRMLDSPGKNLSLKYLDLLKLYKSDHPEKDIWASFEKALNTYIDISLLEKKLWLIGRINRIYIAPLHFAIDGCIKGESDTERITVLNSYLNILEKMQQSFEDLPDLFSIIRAADEKMPAIAAAFHKARYVLPTSNVKGDFFVRKRSGSSSPAVQITQVQTPPVSQEQQSSSVVTATSSRPRSASAPPEPSVWRC